MFACVNFLCLWNVCVLILFILETCNTVQYRTACCYIGRVLFVAPLVLLHSISNQYIRPISFSIGSYILCVASWGLAAYDAEVIRSVQTLTSEPASGGLQALYLTFLPDPRTCTICSSLFFAFVISVLPCKALKVFADYTMIFVFHFGVAEKLRFCIQFLDCRGGDGYCRGIHSTEPH